MIRVILVEDDPVIIERFLSVVTPYQDLAVVGVATTNAQGSELVKKGGYDVLVCDLGLPDGDGTDLVRQSATTQAHADIMVLTMFADHHRVLAAIKAGARGYVLKDQSLDECVVAIRQVFGGGSPITPIIARLLLNELGLRRNPAGGLLLGQPPKIKNEPDTSALNNPLSEREIEALNLLARGFTYAESAELLGISPLTIGSHVKSIYRKLKVTSRAEAVFKAASLGVLGTH
jgi:DNA-binding NarL/FixJ family response regulator